MSPIQIVAVVFALGMAYVSYSGWRRRHFGIAGVLLWQSIWFGLVLVSIFPQLFQWIVKPLHVARLLDVVVVVGMLVLGAITYRNYAIVQRLQEQVEQFVRQQALATMPPELPPRTEPLGQAGDARDPTVEV